MQSNMPNCPPITNIATAHSQNQAVHFAMPPSPIRAHTCTHPLDAMKKEPALRVSGYQHGVLSVGGLGAGLAIEAAEH